MLIYPSINPIAFQLGPLKVHWYGLMYLTAFALAWSLGTFRAKRSKGLWTPEALNDLVFYCALGVVLGGRIGYMIFYNLVNWKQDPISIFYLWEGGMSFHGGLIGVILACGLFAKRYKKTWFETTDFLAPLVPLGLAMGRLGNFINGELWGRITDRPWGMIYPQAGPWPRHPSQIYELLLEGVLLFIIVWIFSSKKRPEKTISGLFLLGYGSTRFFVEFFREPDPQLGFIAGGWVTQGQILSAPMILLGIILIIYGYTKTIKPNNL